MKKLFLSALAVAAMASCSKNEPITDGGAVEILASSVARSIETRAPFEGTITDGTSLKARVLVSAADGDYTTRYHDGNITFTNSGAAGFETPAYYPVSGSTLYLCGLYPADNWQNPTTSAEYTFDGKTDIMAAAQKSSSKSNAQGGSHPQLEFKHLLTKLVIKAEADDAAAITSWGNITEISLIQAGTSSPYTKATVTLKDGIAATGTAFSTTQDSFPFYTITDGSTFNDTPFAAQTVAITEEGANVAYSLVAPISATGSGDFKIRIKTKNQTEAEQTNEATINLKGTDGLEAFSGDTQGKSFVITLTFKATEIKATATVAAWENGGEAGADIQ